MNGTNVAIRSTSADKTSIGFDYQFFYFISLLLNLKMGEVIGYGATFLVSESAA